MLKKEKEKNVTWLSWLLNGPNDIKKTIETIVPSLKNREVNLLLCKQ